MVVFRSVAVPVKATFGYLLSVGAALGAVVVVFQWGWLDAALPGLADGPIVSFLPIFVMGVLFGLAMDYEMFLVSAMREEFVRSGDARDAVLQGFRASSRVVTAAALIMVSVFVAFIPGGSSTIKPIALGLAVGVFVDAFLVRMTFVPAVLVLLGRWAWWLPGWLDRRVPGVDVEGAAMHRRVALQEWAAEHGARAGPRRRPRRRDGREPLSLEITAGPGRDPGGSPRAGPARAWPSCSPVGAGPSLATWPWRGTCFPSRPPGCSAGPSWSRSVVTGRRAGRPWSSSTRARLSRVPAGRRVRDSATDLVAGKRAESLVGRLRAAEGGRPGREDTSTARRPDALLAVGRRRRARGASPPIRSTPHVTACAALAAERTGDDDAGLAVLVVEGPAPAPGPGAPPAGTTESPWSRRERPATSRRARRRRPAAAGRGRAGVGDHRSGAESRPGPGRRGQRGHHHHRPTADGGRARPRRVAHPAELLVRPPTSTGRWPTARTPRTVCATAATTPCSRSPRTSRPRSCPPAPTPRPEAGCS